jgi:hypothetical protein
VTGKPSIGWFHPPRCRRFHQRLLGPTVGCFPSSLRVRYQSTTLPSASGQQAHASPRGERRAVAFTLAAGGNQKPLAVKASVPSALEALVANDFERKREIGESRWIGPSET